MNDVVVEKETTSTGRRAGRNSQFTLTINDPDGTVAAQWELMKKINSRKREAAPETARRCLVYGMIVECEKSMLALEAAKVREDDIRQGRLFD